MSERVDYAMLAAFLEQQPSACFIGEVVRDATGKGAGWRFIRVNAAWERLVGKERAQGEGRLNTDVFPGTSADWLSVFAEMVDAGEPVSFVRRTRIFSGWFEVSAFPLGGELFGASFIDATPKVSAREAREKAEAELHAANDLLANIFRQAPSYMCALRGTEHRFEIVNERFRELVGGRDVVGKTVREALPESAASNVLEILDSVSRVDAPYAATNRRVTLDGGQPPRFIDFVCVPLHGSDGSVDGVLFHGVDQTERKRAEDELREVASELSEMDRRKSDFLATLAHELRNPLAPLRNGLQIMRMAGPNEALAGRARDIMERQVGHLVRLVDDLLDVARISGGKIELRRECCALQEVVARAVETASPSLDSRSHALDVRADDAPVFVDVDETRVAQVLANLLVNAAKYTPPGGAIAIEARAEDGVGIVEVSDNGVGIPAEALPHLFDMFSQVKDNLAMAQGGLGIGLALSRRLVELHGGSIEASSAGAGQGSTFRVCLPLAKEGSRRVSSPPSARSGALGGATRVLRALVVDDNLDAGDSLAARLELAGHETRLARDGVAGLTVAREFKPDIAFLDIGMPGKNGYELAREIRASGKCEGVLLVALTGWGAKRDVDRARAAGFDEHLTKPAADSDVESLLARASKTPEA